MKEGVFIHSFDNQAVKHKPIISTNYPDNIDLFIVHELSDSTLLYPNILGFQT